MNRTFLPTKEDLGSIYGSYRSEKPLAKIICLGVLLTAMAVVAGCRSKAATIESYVRAGYDFEDHDLVAIVDVVGQVPGEQAKNQIADLFTLQLLRKGFAPIQREHVVRLLSEAGFQKGDLSPDAYAIEAGRVLQVPAVLIVNVPTVGLQASLTAKILEVQNGSALWLGSGSNAKVTTKDWTMVSDEPMGTSLFSSHHMAMQAPEQQTEEVEPVDIALSPAQLEPFKIIAQEICKSIPHRTKQATPRKRSWFPSFDQ